MTSDLPFHAIFVGYVVLQDLPHHKHYVTHTYIQNVHQDVIRRVLYVPDGEVIISSSVSSATSVVLMDIHKKKKPYVYKVSKVCSSVTKLNMNIRSGKI